MGWSEVLYSQNKDQKYVITSSLTLKYVSQIETNHLQMCVQTKFHKICSFQIKSFAFRCLNFKDHHRLLFIKREALCYNFTSKIFPNSCSKISMGCFSPREPSFHIFSSKKQSQNLVLLNHTNFIVRFYTTLVLSYLKWTEQCIHSLNFTTNIVSFLKTQNPIICK